MERLRQLLWLFLLTLGSSSVSVRAEAAGVSLGERADAMGEYLVSNRLQCQRLCWYRPLCAAFSFTDRVLDSGHNCVLHADPLLQTIQPGLAWSRHRANDQRIQNGCTNRKCANTEVCVPATSSTQGHRCLSIPVNCGVPLVSGATIDWSTSLQGQTATLTCDAGLDLKPDGFSGQLTCHVTSDWIPLNVTCEIPTQTTTQAETQTTQVATQTTTQAETQTTTQAETVPTTQSCVNGGRMNASGGCDCPLPYTGQYCQRYFRDCTEAYEAGHRNESLSGRTMIQPLNATQPFMVFCRFKWGGVTYAMTRTVDPPTPTPISYDVNWNMLRDGLMADLQSRADSRNYFIGLHNLHLLTLQASYTMHVALSDSSAAEAVGHFYHGIAVGPESSNFQFTYDSYSPRVDTTADNGFAGTGTFVFHTQDRDTNNCYASGTAPGWYDAYCSGYSFFSNSQIVWPQNGADRSWDLLELILERNSSFYDNSSGG